LLSIIFNPEFNVVSFGAAFAATFVSFFAGAAFEGAAFGASALEGSAGLGGSGRAGSTGGGVGLTGSAVAGGGSDFAVSVLSLPEEQLARARRQATNRDNKLLFIGKRV
jgi:hypothetical protein